jgi:MerR family transcriptional regulator, light-induced transcriptional regulator
MFVSPANAMTVSAGEAARRLGVAPATIQRWADQGLLRVERTAGGHRRIPVAELRRFIASSRAGAPKGPIADWIRILISAQPWEISSALRDARHRAPSWAAAADEIASAIVELGRSWEAGECAVFEEHVASELLRRAIVRCVEELPRPGDGPRVALLSVEGERHTLGLSLAELVFAENGWAASWIGEGPPATELERLVEKYSPDVLAVSASSASSPSMIADYQRALMKVASHRRVKLILGGSGEWIERGGVRRVVTFEDLGRRLKRFR